MSVVFFSLGVGGVVTKPFNKGVGSLDISRSHTGIRRRGKFS